MREVNYNRSRPGRKKRRNGCTPGCFVFTVFLVILISLAYVGVRHYKNINLSDKIRKNQYPIKYEHFVEMYSKKYGLDKWLVYGLIRTESRFDVYAVSSANAKGLMQLTDETGFDCAKKLGVSGYTSDKLFDPETNIQFGCYYLSKLIKKYDYLENAIAAYNGGPGNVDSWLADGEHTDSSGKLINIPFTETRNYVERVIEARDMYKKIYEQKE